MGAFSLIVVINLLNRAGMFNYLKGSSRAFCFSKCHQYVAVNRLTKDSYCAIVSVNLTQRRQINQDTLKKALKELPSSVSDVSKYAKYLDFESTTVTGQKLVNSAPIALQPYLKLARVDKPVGFWLLMWPGLTGLALGTGGVPGLWLSVKFAVGAILMRSIGCTINDICDSDLDKSVQRTMSRPLPSGELTILQAGLSGVVQSVAALAILCSLNSATIAAGFFALPLVAAYPYMKRITYYPQAFLGLCMNYGLLMGVTATTGSLSLPVCTMYASLISWTVLYDTIYALQDKKDDMLLGIKSTAIKFGPDVQKYLYGCAACTSSGLFLAGKLAELNPSFYFGTGMITLYLMRQVHSLKPDNKEDCMMKFVDNTKVAFALLLSVLLG